MIEEFPTTCFKAIKGSIVANNLLSILYLAAAAVSLVMLIFGIYARSAPKSLYFTLLTLAIFLYNIGFVMEINATSLRTAVAAAQMQYLGSPFIAPFVLLFVCAFCGIEVKRLYVLTLLIIPVAACLLVQTWHLNGVFYRSFALVVEPALGRAVVSGSAFYIVFQIYNVILPVAADIILIFHFFRRDKVFKKQAALIVIATVLPLVSVISLIFGKGGAYDLTPIFLGVTCLLLCYSFLRLGLYRVAPIAREQIVEAMHDGFIIMDNQGNFIDANVAAKRILPQFGAISIGVKVSDVREIAWLCDPEEVRGNEFSVAGPDGLPRHYRISETDVTHAHKSIGRCIMVYDITESKRLLEEVSILAEHDTLTGLINRRTLFINGERLLGRITTSGGSACMLMLDIDFFKKVNDTYGHMKGDEVLKAVAEVLSSRFRNMEIARYGGEEFCALMSDIAESTALDIAKTMRERIEMLSFSGNDSTFNITISIGLVVFDPTRHLSLDMMIIDADTALYAAKNGGRNTIYIAKAIPGANASDPPLTFPALSDGPM